MQSDNLLLIEEDGFDQKLILIISQFSFECVEVSQLIFDGYWDDADGLGVEARLDFESRPLVVHLRVFSLKPTFNLLVFRLLRLFFLRLVLVFLNFLFLLGFRFKRRLNLSFVLKDLVVFSLFLKIALAQSMNFIFLRLKLIDNAVKTLL